MSRPSPAGLRRRARRRARRRRAHRRPRSREPRRGRRLPRRARIPGRELLRRRGRRRLFWALLFGLPGMLAYKAINTADSMIGHRTRAPSRLRLGCGPARRSAQSRARTACRAAVWRLRPCCCPAASAAGAAAPCARDARRHRSPNAGWPEAALAGALGLALPARAAMAADRRGSLDERRRPPRRDAADIRRGLTLYLGACLLQGAVVAVLAIL